MKLFLCSLCLAIALESLCFSLFPDAMRNSMLEMSRKPAGFLRSIGAAGLVIAALIALLVKGLFPA